MTDTTTVKSAHRALQLLDTLSAGPMTVADLHRQTGYPRSSLHQLLLTLTSSGWVETLDDGTVGVGSRALIVGTSYLDRDAALQLAVETLEEVRDRSGYTAHYARREHGHVLYLATRETTNSHRMTSRVGRRLPAHATALGKALLAELSAEELNEALGEQPLAALTPQTITDRQQLTDDLARTRERGYAFEELENSAASACVAAAVGYRIPATDAISCSLPVERATAAEIDRVAEIVTTASAALATRLRIAGIR